MQPLSFPRIATRRACIKSPEKKETETGRNGVNDFACEDEAEDGICVLAYGGTPPRVVCEQDFDQVQNSCCKCEEYGDVEDRNHPVSDRGTR